MYKILQKVALGSQFLMKCKFLYFVALMGILVFSAFNSRPDKSPSFEEAATLLPPDSLSRIDLEGTKHQIKKIKFERQADSLVNFALSLTGMPYRYGGNSTKGFDCSGFVYHVFNRFGFNDLNRSSRTQAIQGSAVELEQAQKGDLLFFTGTNPQQRQVGHVGIVVSAPGEEVQFVHSSSNGGVKVSKLEGYYETRFMQAKRILRVK